MLVLDSPRFGSLSSSVLAALTRDKIDDRANTDAERRAKTVSAEKSNTGWNRYFNDSISSIVLHADDRRKKSISHGLFEHSKKNVSMIHSGCRLDKKNGVQFQRFFSY